MDRTRGGMVAGESVGLANRLRYAVNTAYPAARLYGKHHQSVQNDSCTGQACCTHLVNTAYPAARLHLKHRQSVKNHPCTGHAVLSVMRSRMRVFTPGLQ